MKILSLHIENFGRLQNFTLEPEAGLNVLYQKNGWGKSTLAVFIKAMLYGLPASSRRSLDENERKKYTPWQGGVFGGSMELETSKGRFRIERTFAQKESGDSFSLYDLATNMPSTAYSAAIGEELFGIDADGFERSTYLSQRALGGGKDNNSISAKLGNLLDDVGDIGNYDTALAALEKRRRFYVMTGNRGAIADLEEERLAKQTELERLFRVREALEVQEAELAECAAQLQAVRKTAEETRARIGQASLARERAALLEQKDAMLRELADLTAQKEQTDAFFRGQVPTYDELNESRRLYQHIQESSARLKAIAGQTDDAEALSELRAAFPNGLPDGDELAYLERENDTLRQLCARREALQNAQSGDVLTQRFPTGAPSPAELASAREALAKAENLQKVIDNTAQPPKKANAVPLTLFSILVLLVGTGLAILSFLPVLKNVSPVLLIVGIVCAITGVILCVASVRSRSKRRSQTEALQRKRQTWQTQREEALRAVQALLKAYRMPCDDAVRSLTELSLLAEQYRSGIQQRRRAREELDAINRRREEVSASLRAYLSRFLGTCPQKEDFRAEIDELRRGTATDLRLQAAERKRLAAHAAEETELNAWKERLQPFLLRYAPSGRIRADECLNRVGEQLSERTRLLREIARREAELKSFISEKRLDQLTDTPDAGEFDRLSATERELQARAADLQRKHATLKSGIDRLSQDADRIPELETELSQLKLRIEEARANAATIQNTAKLLEEAKTALSTRYLDGMQQSFRHFLSVLTDADAPESVMDTSFEVRLREGGQSRTMESFSRGWRDAVEFCVRLSLTAALYAEGEKPFLLLDDPFVNLDDDRLAAARQLLETLSEQYQILYLVCHKDRI